MVDRDDRQLRTIAFYRDLNCGLVESGVDVVYWDRVVRVRRIATHIAHNAELAVGRLEALQVDEWWDWLGQVDAVDEDVGLDNLGVGAGSL